MPKYYIPEFYIKNFFLSCLALISITAIVIFIIDNISSVYISFGIAVPIGITGLITTGYFNASSACKEKNEQPLYIHIFIITLLFITNNIWGDTSIFINFLREFSYLVFLQFGVYLFNKKYGFK